MTPYTLEQGPVDQLRKPTTAEVLHLGKCAQKSLANDAEALFAAINDINSRSEHLIGMTSIAASNILYADQLGTLNSRDPLITPAENENSDTLERDFDNYTTVKGFYNGLIPIYLGDSDHDEATSGISLINRSSSGSGILNAYYAEHPNQYHVFVKLRRQMEEVKTEITERTYWPNVFAPVLQVDSFANLRELDLMYGGKALDQTTEQAVTVIQNIIEIATEVLDPTQRATDHQLQTIEAWDARDYHVMNEVRSSFIELIADEGFIYSSPDDIAHRKHTLTRPVKHYHAYGLFNGVANAYNSEGNLRPHFVFYIINEESSDDYASEVKDSASSPLQSQLSTHMNLLVPVSKEVELLVAPSPY